MDTERGVLNTGVYWGEKGRARGRGQRGGVTWGEMPNVGEGVKANHIAMYVPMQQYCMFFTCIPEPKMQ